MTITSVTLTWPEAAIAARVGEMRQAQNVRLKRRDRHVWCEENAWTIHIEGSGAEMATAKYLGVYWSGNVGDLDADDVGRVQVRRAAKEHYRLILHPDDNDDRPFVHATGSIPNFRLHGWIMCRDGKLQKWWDDPKGDRAAFFVPGTLPPLLPMEQLKADVRAGKWTAV